MTAFEKRILFGLGLLIILLSVLEASVPKPVDWSPSYSRFHDKPLGASLVYERLKDLFPDLTSSNEALVATGTNFNEEYQAMSMHTPKNHIFINSYLHLEPDVAKELMNNVYMGDHVFFAMEGIGGVIAEDLKIEIASTGSYLSNDTGDVRFIGENRVSDGVYRYVRGTSGAHFTRYDTVRTRVLAVNGRSEPVLLEMAYGSGRFVLSSIPQAFTNFNLLKNTNARFMAGAFSALPIWPTVWHEYAKDGNSGASTPLRYLLSQPALRWAWFIALALVFLYIAVYARRQQRAIPIVTPPMNASRELVHTIGRLYWHKGDHTDLAHKMIAHFKDDVRQRTYLRTFAYDQATIMHLSAKTGLTNDVMAQRLGSIEHYGTSASITETQLLQLSKELHEFRQLIR